MRKYLPRVLRYLKPYTNLAVASAIVIFVAGLVGLLAPWPLKIVVDHALGQKPMPQGLQRLVAPLAQGGTVPLIVVAVVAGFLIAILGDALAVLSPTPQATVSEEASTASPAPLDDDVDEMTLAGGS